MIDPADRLWILDTGRTALPNGTLPTSAFGGPKLVSINLSNKSIFTTILFPETVAFPDSCLNNERFGLWPSLTPSGGGLAYITDSSSEGPNGIVIVDLGNGSSWRHLNNVPSVRSEPCFFVQSGELPPTTARARARASPSHPSPSARTESPCPPTARHSTTAPSAAAASTPSRRGSCALNHPSRSSSPLAPSSNLPKRASLTASKATRTTSSTPAASRPTRSSRSTRPTGRRSRLCGIRASTGLTR